MKNGQNNFSLINTQEIFFLGSLIAVFYFISTYNYLLFHGLAESLSIIISGASFLVFWSLRKTNLNSFFSILSLSLLFAGFMDLVHLLVYKGMGVFPQYDTNIPTQLWIAARYFQSITLLLSILLMKKKINYNYVFSIFFLITVSLLSSILYFGNFPDCFIEGSGLTPFKIYSEYIISLILVLCLFLFVKNKK